MINYFIGEINNENLKEVFGYGEKEANISNLLNKDMLKKFNLESGIIYFYDKIVTDSVDNLDFDLENIIEARIFNEMCELKVWRDGDVLRGCIFKEQDCDIPPMEERYILYPRKTGGASPNILKVRKYMDYDSDGQAYISYVKPSKFE